MRAGIIFPVFVLAATFCAAQDHPILGDWEAAGGILTIYKAEDKIYVVDDLSKHEAFIKKNKINVGQPVKYSGEYFPDQDILQLGGLNFRRFTLLYTIMPLTASKNEDTLILAMKKLDSLLHIYPDIAKLNLLMGNVKYHLNDSLEQAQAYYNAALRKIPDYYEANFNMGCVLLENDSMEAAIPYFDRALKRRPEANEALYNLAECYYKIEEPDSAIRYFKEAMKDMDDSIRIAFTMYRIGRCYGKMKNDLDNAIKYISEAISFDSTGNSYYEDLGVAYGFKKDFDSAIRVLEMGIRHDPAYAPFYRNLGVTYKALGQSEKSEEYFEKERELEPEELRIED